MGRRVEYNRKISIDRVGEKRKQKNKIVIAVEANPNTEIYKIVSRLIKK